MSKTSIEKLQTHVSLALKSFDLTVTELKSQTVLGHLQSVYKKKKYFFYIVNHLKEKEAYGIKFKASIEWCDKNNVNFVVVAKTWDQTLNDFETRNDYLWKIIPMDKLTKLGRDYIDLKEKEADEQKKAS